MVGVESAVGRGDFWVVDDNYGWRRHTVYIFNLALFTPSMVNAARKLLQGHPNWEIIFLVDVVGKEKEWPPMGVTIRKREIIDGLQREYLPAPYNQLEFSGSRPGTGYD